jgi:hypothetical protein
MALSHTGGLGDCVAPQEMSREIVAIYNRHKAGEWLKRELGVLAMWREDNIPPGVVLAG